MAAPRTAAVIASSTIPAYARTAGRAVHIKIQPRPLNVGESRQILRTLERYGEVVMYKHLKVGLTLIPFLSRCFCCKVLSALSGFPPQHSGILNSINSVPEAFSPDQILKPSYKTNSTIPISVPPTPRSPSSALKKLPRAR